MSFGAARTPAIQKGAAARQSSVINIKCIIIPNLRDLARKICSAFLIVDNVTLMLKDGLIKKESLHG